MPHIHGALFHRYRRGLIVVVHAHVEGGTADRDHRGRRQDPVWVRLPAPFLDVYFHPTDEQIQKIAQVAGVLAEDNVRIRINLKEASIGNLELRVTVCTGDDDLLDLDLVANVQGPRLAVPQNGNLSIQRYNVGSGITGGEEQLG